MTANSKFYLNKLVYKYNNTYHRSIGKKPVDADYFVLTKETDINPKSPKFKVFDRVRITKYKNVLTKVTPKIGRMKYLWLILCWKLILRRTKLKT